MFHNSDAIFGPILPKLLKSKALGQTTRTAMRSVCKNFRQINPLNQLPLIAAKSAFPVASSLLSSDAPQRSNTLRNLGRVPWGGVGAVGK